MSTESFPIEYVKTIGIVNNGLNGRGFTSPYDSAVSKDGRIFVLNRCDQSRRVAIRVGILNMEEDYLGEFGYGYGEGEGQMRLPVAMAFDSRDRLHITDELNHRITVYDTSGAVQGHWGEHGEREGQLNGPAGIAIDDDDNVYVVDQHNHRVQKFSADGGFLLGWGGPGQGSGQFNMPWGITLDSQGQVYVADWRNDRVQKFSAEGDFVASYGESGDGDGQLSRPSSVAVDPEGYIYVADWGNERVQVLAPDGGFTVGLRGQATLSKWAEEFLSVNPDESGPRLESNLVPELPPHLSTPHDISAQTEPYFWSPVSVKLDGDGRMYVTESARHRLQIYRKG